MIEVDIDTIPPDYPDLDGLRRLQRAMSALAALHTLGLAYYGCLPIFSSLPLACASTPILLQRSDRALTLQEAARAIIQAGADQVGNVSALHAIQLLFTDAHSFYFQSHASFEHISGFIIRPLSLLLILDRPTGKQGGLFMSDVASAHETIAEVNEMALEFKDHLVFPNRI